jgi:hypothetical protein
MLANIDEIVTDCRSLLDEPSTVENKFYSDTEIIRWANEGAEKFTSFTRVLCKYYSYTIQAAQVKNDRELRLSSDFVTFDSGGVLYNDHPLTESSLLFLDEWMGLSWRDHTGTPQYFYRRGDYIGFYPKCTAGDTVKYYGIERAPTMVSADGVAPLSGDYRLVAFRCYIRDYAMAQCYWKKGNKESYREKMAEFEKGIFLVNTVVNGHSNQPNRMVPSRGNKRVTNINPLNM